MKISNQTAETIAKLISGKVIGDGNRLVTGMNELHVIQPGDLAFVDHPKYYDKVLGSSAGSILINKELPPLPNKTLIFSHDPFRDFIELIRHFRPFVPSTDLIDPTAHIHPEAVIQPGARIGKHVKIGQGTVIHSNVSVGDHVEIGENCIIHASAVIGGDAFYYQKKNGKYIKFESGGTVIIDNEVEIGANTTVDRGVTGNTTIGAGTKIDNLVHIGHDTQIGKNCLFAAQVGIAGATIIEDDVTLWGQVGVISGITIGKGAVVMAQSGIGKTVEGNQTYFGSPASPGREKMKEMAALRQLPELLKKLK